jgi:hypothetical protein
MFVFNAKTNQRMLSYCPEILDTLISNYHIGGYCDSVIIEKFKYRDSIFVYETIHFKIFKN